MKTLPNPFYYLENFQRVLEWICSRYSDLLTEDERIWINRFSGLPQNARALLARLVMRKGSLFRSGKLVYEEIGCPHEAARPLIAEGWVEDDPALGADSLHDILKKAELLQLLTSQHRSGCKKSELFEQVQAAFPGPVRFASLFPDSGERIYLLSDEVSALCDRLRLMFFGNLYQGWTEFVLADLGIYQYEKVNIDEASRGFRRREDVDAYLHLHALRERFDAGEPPDAILEELEQAYCDNDWIAERRARFLFHVAQHLEQSGELKKALQSYRRCSYPGARVRCIRVLEKTGNYAAAFDLAQAAQHSSESGEEAQHLERIMPRLRRKLGLAKLAPPACPPVAEWLLALPLPEENYCVELEVCRHLSRDEAPVFYLENALVNSLFGLLCWDAVFHPLPGAFFHLFHTGPADLHSPDFYQRRKAQFDACFAQLESGAYKHTIRQRLREKAGIQSPFVFWGALDEALLELALECIPAAHLRHWFGRILEDIRANRNGFPDLVQFWPQERRYRMIEVKAPGDRLQDNQLRMLAFAQRHGMPVSVCYVEWKDAAA